MNNKKLDWRLRRGLIISYYILGMIAFSLIGDLSELTNQIIYAIFVIAIIREVWRFVNRYKQEKQK